MRKPLLIVAAAALLLATGARAATRDQLVVTPAWLAAHAGDKTLVILHVGSAAGYKSGHIPGARLVDSKLLQVSQPNLSVEVPPPEMLQKQLESRGFRNIVRWTRGVNVQLFKPGDKKFLDLPRPIFAYLGRVAVEKNIEAFLSLDLPGTKLVMGDGPERLALQARFPAAVFVGYKFGAELAAHLAAVDVFTFPSRTDTFGLVLLEALACGVPVAAYPVTGPIDVIENGTTGVLDADLRVAALAALKIDPAKCRAFALQHTWEAATNQFLGNLAPREARVGLKPDLQPDPQRLV